MKKLKNCTLIAVLTLTLSACATKEKLGIVLDSYIGYSSKNLFDTFGHPKNIQQNGANTLYYYGFQASTYSPPTTSIGLGSGFGRRGNYFSGINTGFGSGYYRNYSCSISFNVDASGEIINADASGNSCNQYAKRSLVNPKFILDLPKLEREIEGFTYKKTKRGLVVKSVLKEGLAYNAGLREGDIIQSINQVDITRLPIEFALQELNKSKKVNVELLRDKRKMIFNIEKSQLPLLSLYSKSARKFLGF
jgi:hypothetical protein